MAASGDSCELARVTAVPVWRQVPVEPVLAAGVPPVKACPGYRAAKLDLPAEQGLEEIA